MKKKGIILTSLAVVIVAGGAFIFLTNSGPNPDQQTPTIKVSRATIVDKVLAVGTIEPEQQIQVKSKVSGIVNTIFRDAGSYVKKGEPLLEIKPDPTPTELAEATRLVTMEQTAFSTIEKEKNRQATLKDKGLISNKDFEDILQQYETARLRLESANDKLSLLKQGKVSIQNTVISSVIRSEIDGFVLEKMVNIGDPVVPSTSFQPGQALMTVADMNSLLFKGTVDEINVGKLKVGQKVELKIGALPKETITGTLRKISLKAQKKDNATNFDVEITIDNPESVQLRAGYSANADIIIKKKEDVLSLPERVITFSNDSAFVYLPDTVNQTRIRKPVVTGMSNAINIEIVSGLAEGDAVLEPELKSIK